MTVAVIGLGAVGSSLARSLHQGGHNIVALIDRSKEVATSIAVEVDGGVASTRLEDIPSETRLIFICTREDAIPAVVDGLQQTSIDWSGCVVAHVSGRQASSVLAPLAERGAGTLSFHPLGSFPPKSTEKTMQGLTIGLEGVPDAVAVGRTIAADIGAQGVEIPPGKKSVYHLAAVMTSNYLVTLMDDVQCLLAQVDLPVDLTHALAQDTLDNLRSTTPRDALTGPIVRADGEALAEQVALLSEVSPAIVERFVTLADATIELAVRSGRVSEAQRTELQEILKNRKRT